MTTRHSILAAVVLFALALGMMGCSGDNIDENGGVLPEGPLVATCEGCHTNQEMLIAVAEPDEPPESEGEG